VQNKSNQPCCRTGQGKTLAFVLPIVERLLAHNTASSARKQYGRMPRVIVLAPTRELAKQVQPSNTYARL
jgi:ATP-dependent RNA helicase DDX21